MRRIVVVVGVTLLLAACGQGQQPRERLTAAAEATSSAGSAEFSMEMVMNMSGASGDGSSGESSGGEATSGMNMTITGEGVMDFQSQAGRLSLQVPGLGSGMETVYDGDTVYTQMPSMVTGGEAQWVRQESPGLSQGMSTTSGMGSDPSEMLEALGAASDEVEDLGDDEVRGESVQGYGFTLTAADLQGAQDVPEGFADLEIPAEAWLDSEGRLRRMVTEIDMGQLTEAAAASTEASDDAQALSGMGGAVGGTMTMTMELWNFGTSVDVEPPEDDQVIDAEQFEQQMRQGLGGSAGQGPGAGPSDGGSGPSGSGDVQMPEDPEEVQQMVEDLMENTGS